MDHAWIAEDKSGSLAYVACCLEDALPRKVCIDKRLMAGLDNRLKAYFDVDIDVKTGMFDLLASKGFYVYDAVRTAGGEPKYALVGRPDRAILADVLPPSLKVVACCFAIRDFEFAQSKQLPVCNLFARAEDISRCSGLYRRAMASICECGTPRVSVSEATNHGFGAAERLERGYFDMHAVMGFGDVGNEIATLYKWEAYVKYFKALLRYLSCIKSVGEVCVQGNDGRWIDSEDYLSTEDFLHVPPNMVCLKNPSGLDIAELELECMTSCAACADSCRYLIQGSYSGYVAITKAIASSARQVGVPFVLRSRNWMSRIFAQWCWGYGG